MTAPRLVLVLSLLLPGLLAPLRAGAAALAFDTDGDGAFDLAVVGDWDDNGILETRDVQAGVDALDDPGAKIVNVAAGVYRPPVAAPAAVALVALPSHTTLRCAPGAVLQGMAPPPAGPDVDIATVSNRDPVAGNTGVVVTGCEITGGMPDSFDSTAFLHRSRAGLDFHAVTDGRVSDNFVHHTLHSCLYSKNSRRVRFERNVAEDCGGRGDTSARVGQPGIYLYVSAGAVVEDFALVDNVVRRTGGAGLNLRRNAAGDTFRNIVMSGNRVEDTYPGVDCITLRGVDGISITDTTCIRTGPVGTAPNAAAFYSDPSPHVDSVRGLAIDGLTAIDVRNGPGLYLRGWVEDVTVRNLTVHGTEGQNPCLMLKTPFRRTSFDGVVAEECAGEGFLQETCTTCGTDGDGLELRNVRIDGADVLTPFNSTPAAGVRFSAQVRDLVLENVEISRISGIGIDFGPNAVTSAVVRDVAIDGVPARFVGARTAASLPPCAGDAVESWALVTDAGETAPCAGGGTGRAFCRCTTGAWRYTTQPLRYGIWLRGGSSRSVLFDGVSAANFEASYGIRIDGAPGDLTVLAPSAVDDSPATPTGMQGAVDYSSGAALTLTGATCTGTAPGSPCVRSMGYYPDSDSDGNGIGGTCDVACADGIDNDLNGAADYPADRGCASSTDTLELTARCGLGWELALLAPLLRRLARLRRAA
jgi:hypothetical protein